jgi:hypothetical protein
MADASLDEPLPQGWTIGVAYDSGVAGDNGGNTCVTNPISQEGCVIVQTSAAGTRSVQGTVKLPMASQTQSVRLLAVLQTPSGSAAAAMYVKVCAAGQPCTP